MKKLATISFALLLTSACSLGSFQQKIEVLDNLKSSEVRVATNSEFKSLQNRGSLQSDEQLYIANLGTQNGAQILVKFDFNSFKTKATNPIVGTEDCVDGTNCDGIPEKTAADVASVDVYLFKLASNFNPAIPAGKDPFGPSSQNLYWSKSGVTKNGTAINLLFTGVPGDASNHYYAGVVARDSGNNVISKNGYKWTGTTATYAGFNLSSSGVGVDATSLVVSTTDPLSIGVNLLDAVGAKLDSTVEITNGSSALPSISPSPYSIAN